MKGHRLLIVTGTVAGIGAITFLVLLVFFHRYRVPSVAMTPTVNPGDWIWTRPTSGGDARRADVIVFRPPRQLGPLGSNITTVISRVVAIEGDTVAASGGHLLVNGEQVDEPYLGSVNPTPDIPETEVPKDTVYVLGDNRSNSQGSHVYGAVPFANVEQRVVRVGGPSIGVLWGVVALLCLPFLVLLARTMRRARHRPKPSSPSDEDRRRYRDYRKQDDPWA